VTPKIARQIKGRSRPASDLSGNTLWDESQAEHYPQACSSKEGASDYTTSREPIWDRCEVSAERREG